MRIGGVVLCGGRSSRMGQPKAWLHIGDEVLLQRVVRILREVVEPVVVVAAPGQEVPELPVGVEMVRDSVEGRGPLQGLATGLTALTGKVDAVYLSSCDAPFLHAAFVRRMVNLLDEASSIAVPHIGDYHHPLASVYRVSVLDAVNSLLAANRMRPVFLFDAVPTRIVLAPELIDIDPTFESLRNINTPEEYEIAMRDYAARSYNHS